MVKMTATFFLEKNTSVPLLTRGRRGFPRREFTINKHHPLKRTQSFRSLFLHVCNIGELVLPVPHCPLYFCTQYR